MDLINRTLQPEKITTRAALSMEDAINAGMVEQRLVIEPLVDPTKPTMPTVESARGVIQMACPSVMTPVAERLNWLKGSVQRGMAFLQAQPNYDKLQLTTRIMQGLISDDDKFEGFSTAHINHLKRQGKEIIAHLSANLKPEVAYGTTDNTSAALQSIADHLETRFKSWFKGNTFPAKRIKEVLQHAILGIGYLSPIWRNELFGSSAADMDFKVYGMESVYFDQMPQDWNEQLTYAVTMFERVPTFRLRQAWPLQAEFIIPSFLTAEEPGKKASGAEQALGSSRNNNPIFAMLEGNDNVSDKKTTGGNISSRFIGTSGTYYTDVYMTYIMDGTINSTGKVIKASDLIDSDTLHKPDPELDYVIPPIDTRVNLKNPEDTEKGRKYSHDRCLLYPTRRLIIWTPEHILYDGGSWLAHGMVPLIKVQLDPQVWSLSGGNLIEDNRRLSKSLNSMLRGWVDALNARLEPPLEYDEGEISPTTVEGLNLRKPGIWIKRMSKSALKQAIRVILPYQHYEVQNEVVPFLEFAINRMNHVLGTEEFKSLTLLQAIPNADEKDKLILGSGPIMADYANALEEVFTMIGYQFAWMCLQYDDTISKLQTMGLSSLHAEELDEDAGSMVPAKLELGDELTNSSRFYRLRALGKKILFSIVPQSIFQVTHFQRQMLMFQLFREPKFPLDSETFAKTLGLENFGKIPGETIYEKWVNEQKARIPFEASLQAQAAQIQMVGQGVGQAQAQMAAAVTAQQLQQGITDGVIDPEMASTFVQMLLMAGQQQYNVKEMEGLYSSGAGRPPTAQQAPQLEQKQNGDGTLRNIVTES